MKKIGLISLSIATLVIGCGGGGGDAPAPASAAPLTSSTTAPTPTPTPAPAPAPTPTPTPTPTPAPAPAPAPVIADVLPSSLFRETKANGAQSFKLTAGIFSLSGQRLANGVGEMAISATEGDFNVQFDPAKSAVIVSDKAQKLTVVNESGPKGSVIRTYDSMGVFVIGYFIEFGDLGQRTLWRMIADGTTEPSNLTNGRRLKSVIATHSPVRLKSNVNRQSASSNGESCYSYMNSITGSSAEYANEAGDALDSDDAPDGVKKVGRVAKFLGWLWSKVPQTCDDAPEPVSSNDLEKETMLEALKAAGPAGVRSLLEKYASFQNFLEENKVQAEFLQAAISGLPSSQQSAVGTAGTSSTNVGLDPLSTDVGTSIAQTQELSIPTRVYVSGSLSCLDVQFDTDWVLKNNCGYDIITSWCLTNNSSCTFSNSASLLANTAYTVISQNQGIYYAACQRLYNDKAVVITQKDVVFFQCSYLSR